MNGKRLTLGSHTEQQGLKPADFEFLVYHLACQSPVHADINERLGHSFDGA